MKINELKPISKKPARAKPKNPPHPMSLEALGNRYGVCRATLYNEIHAGRLEVTKIGARTIVTPEQELAWLDLSRQKLSAKNRQYQRARGTAGDNGKHQQIEARAIDSVGS